MAVYTQAKFAKKLGVSRQRVWKAVKSGLLELEPNGRIDDENPTNLLYRENVLQEANEVFEEYTMLEKDATSTPGVVLSRENVKKQLRKPVVSEDRQVAHDLVARGREIDNKLKTIKVSRERIKYYEEIGKSIPVSVVARGLSKISAVMNEQLGMFADRHAAFLYAMPKADKTETEFREQLDLYMQESLASVITNVSQIISKYKESEKDGD